ncbi:MAG: hypothetical protein V1706_10425 [Pseudomonadota bacterium]
MLHEKENALRDAQLACFGRLLSGFTHDLKNHLAIINESSGLMGDLLEMGKGREDETCKKFQKIIATIAERVELANVIVKNLNGFAHRMDMAVSVFSVNDVLREEMALMYRFARLKGVGVDMKMEENLPSSCSNPALIQFLLYIFVDSSLARMKTGGELKLVTKKDGDVVVVQLEARGGNGGTDDGGVRGSHAELVAFVVEKLGINMGQEMLDNGWVYRLTLPAV